MTVIPTIRYTQDRVWAPGIRGSSRDPLPGAPETDFAHPHIDRNALLVDELIAAIEEDREPCRCIRGQARNRTQLLTL